VRALPCLSADCLPWQPARLWKGALRWGF